MTRNEKEALGGSELVIQRGMQMEALDYKFLSESRGIQGAHLFCIGFFHCVCVCVSVCVFSEYLPNARGLGWRERGGPREEVRVGVQD